MNKYATEAITRPGIALAVERALHRLHRPVEDRLATEALALLAQEAYTAGRHDALMGLRTIAEAAGELGLTPDSLRIIAARLQVGWRPHPNVLLLTREDIERIRHRPRGRPGRKPRAAAEGVAPATPT